MLQMYILMFNMKRYHISMLYIVVMDKPWHKILLLFLVIFCYIRITWANNSRHNDVKFDEYVFLDVFIL